mmetsp:Transcript_17367/g.22107  ORF Transcript_17367/g.22107 Transcript_17367/m.22107 type:complete len:170 (-) Transcript_17367:14-523(-)
MMMKVVLFFALIALVCCQRQLQGQEYTITYFGENTCSPESAITERTFILGECYDLQYNSLNTECDQSLECLFAPADDFDANVLCPRQFSVDAITVLPDIGIVLEVNPTGCNTNSVPEHIEFGFGECRQSPNYEGCFSKIRLDGPRETASPASALAVPAVLFLALLGLFL